MESTNHLKDRFRILLGRFLAKKAQRQFDELTRMIMDFDKNDPKPKKF